MKAIGTIRGATALAMVFLALACGERNKAQGDLGAPTKKKGYGKERKSIAACCYL